MHLHAALLFQLTLQNVSAFRISQTKSDPRAYLEPRGEPEPVRPEVVEHPVIPVIDPVPAPVPQQGNEQTDHGTDDRPLSDTEPGLSNLLPNQGSQGQHVDFGHGLANVLNSWPDTIPSYAFDLPLPWEVESDSIGNSRIPLLQPPDSISAEYQHPPISDTSNKRKNPSSGVTYSNRDNKKLKRTQTRKEFKQLMLDKINKIEEIAEQGKKVDQANEATIKQLEAENKDLRERLAAYELQALSSTTATIPNEFDRMFVSNGAYQQVQLPEFSLPVGQSSGGFTFGDPGGVTDSNIPGLTSEQDLTYFENYLPSFENWLNFPPQPGSHQKQRRAQSQSHGGNNARYMERRQRNHISRRSNSQPTMKDPASEYEFYINVYTEIRANVSNLLVPYFTPILEQANNSLIYDMVRSIHSDLVAYGPWTLGPYSNGHHCFDWIEYQLFGNITDDMISKNETILGVFADHAILIDIYDNIWGNATQIANATGYLTQMHTLRGYLNPKNTSIIPASWKSVQPLKDSLSFDVLYNRTLHS